MFSALVESALRVSAQAHAGQMRKSALDVHYSTHPAHVALLLARLGFDDTVISAALLHDVAEDCEGWDVARIEREFGPAVATIVGQLTEDKSKSWDERKRHAVEHVAHMSAPAVNVKAADKLHNLETLVAELRATKDRSAVWAHFNGGRERTLAMSSALVDALEPRVHPTLGRSLRLALRELERLAADPQSS